MARAGIVIASVSVCWFVCDGLDNDCDMEVDEDFDLQTDRDNCGACNNQCGDEEACEAGECVGA